MTQISENDVAIIGMAGRFPKADNIHQFWQNLVDGVNTIVQASPEDIIASGMPKEITNHKRFVNASSRLENAKYFDADFFNLSNLEANLMDPQIRLLLQCSWHAIEDAGYDISRMNASVGNYCGMSTNSYLLSVLNTNVYDEHVDPLLYRILNDKDFLATWISYKLNLTGPSMSVQTACSTSLLAVHLACQSLLNRECDMALAGGVAFDSRESIGYIYTPESIYSKDGVCRPFDKKANGIINGDGVGVILLKRANEAIKDNDHIYALIKGTAVNNDGSNKQGYTAPSVNYQRDVILEALALSDIDPITIGLIEAHGTGTLIGDPIEVAALSEAFRQFTLEEQYCAIGSVKSNIGHLDAASGIASLIKATMSVNKGVLVPSINFNEANPALNIDRSPFYVNQKCQRWPNNFDIRRAGISSLGVGGTNVHVIIEEGPIQKISENRHGPFFIAITAKNRQSLGDQKEQLQRKLLEDSSIQLSDLEFTTVYGRKVFNHRFTSFYHEKEELLNQLNGDDDKFIIETQGNTSSCIFLFPGQGSQFQNMSRELYENMPEFKLDMDNCFNILKKLSIINYQEILFSENTQLLDQTENTQVCIFIVEYCLAQQLKRIGIYPSALIGHSLGEYVAACFVGCLSLEDALTLVYYRGKLMGMMPKGGMIAVKASYEEFSHLLLSNSSISGYNTNDNFVIGSSEMEIDNQCLIFQKNNIQFKKLSVSHAYHTSMMNSVIPEYEKILDKVRFNHFESKLFSTSIGSIIGPEQFCTKKYWLDQILQPVRFVQAVQSASSYFTDVIFVEVGPGNTLSSFVNTIIKSNTQTVSILLKPSNQINAVDKFFQAITKLFSKGVGFNIPEVAYGKRISLPGYSFDRKKYWKPKRSVTYDNYTEINNAYHFNHLEKYRPEYVRSILAFKLDDSVSLSKEVIEQIDELHNAYIKDISEILRSEKLQLHTSIEVLFKEINSGLKHKSNTLRSKTNLSLEARTDTEKIISVYWERILGYQSESVFDNYFDVGGNSLLATSFLAQLSEKFNVMLSFKELTECPNIKELGTLIDSKLKMEVLINSLEIDHEIDENFIEI